MRTSYVLSSVNARARSSTYAVSLDIPENYIWQQPYWEASGIGSDDRLCVWILFYFTLLLSQLLYLLLFLLNITFIWLVISCYIIYISCYIIRCYSIRCYIIRAYIDCPYIIFLPIMLSVVHLFLLCFLWLSLSSLLVSLLKFVTGFVHYLVF